MEQNSEEEAKKLAAQKLGVAAVDKADDPDPLVTQPEQTSHPSTPNYGEGGPGMHSGKNLAGVPEEFLHLFEHDPSEVISYQVKRHPIGVFGIYAGTVSGIVLVLVLYSLIVTNKDISQSIGLSSSVAASVGGLVSLLLVALTAVIGLASAYIYKKSRLILTNQKVVFIQYHSLISRQISQLNIGEVEDVSVVQPSLINRIFKTGTITIETAGEQHNYKFSNAENPYEFAHRTIQAHEGAIQEYGN